MEIGLKSCIGIRITEALLPFHQQDQWGRTLHWGQLGLWAPQDHLLHGTQACQPPPTTHTERIMSSDCLLVRNNNTKENIFE